MFSEKALQDRDVFSENDRLYVIGFSLISIKFECMVIFSESENWEITFM